MSVCVSECVYINAQAAWLSFTHYDRQRKSFHPSSASPPSLSEQKQSMKKPHPPTNLLLHPASHRQRPQFIHLPRLLTGHTGMLPCGGMSVVINVVRPAIIGLARLPTLREVTVLEGRNKEIKTLS